MFTLRFIFAGAKYNFISQLKSAINTSNMDYLYEIIDNNHINIGIQRLGHSGGRWFIAEVNTVEESTIFQGEFEDIYLSSISGNKPADKIKDFIITLVVYIAIYSVLLGISLLIWSIANLRYIIIPFIVPAIILVVLRINAITWDKRLDKKFITFMTEAVGCILTKE